MGLAKPRGLIFTAELIPGGKESMTDEERREVLAEELLKQRKNRNWQHVPDPKQAPQSAGHYAIFDGIEIQGAGVTEDCRHSLTVRSAHVVRRCILPICLFLPQGASDAQ